MINPNMKTASIGFRQSLQNHWGAEMLLRVSVESDEAEALLEMRGNDRNGRVCFRFDDEGQPVQLAVDPGMMTKYVFADTEFEGLKKEDAQLLSQSELEDTFIHLQGALKVEGNSLQLDIAETWQRALDAVHGEHATVADMLALGDPLHTS